MKYILYRFVFILTFVCLLTSPANSSERIVKVSLSKNPPLVFTDDKGEAQGIYIDITKHIAREEGWTIQYVPCKWSECQQKLQIGEIDLLMSIAYTEERAEKFDFTKEPVFNNWAYIYRKAGSDIESIVDLENRKVATVKGNIHSKGFVKTLKSFNIQSEIIEVSDYPDVFRLIDEGKVSAGVVNRLNGLKYEAEFNAEKTSIIFNPVELLFATPKGKNSEIRTAIDRHLTELKKNRNSIYYRSLNKWLGIRETTAFPAWLWWTLAIAIGALLLLLVMNQVLRIKVKQRTEELKKSHNKLEDKVRERTSEFIKANEELQAEIVERKRAEEALRESEERYKRLSEVAIEGIVLHDKGVAVELNSTFAKMFGYEVRELIGKNVIDLVARPEYKDLVFEKIATGFDKPYEIMSQRKDGTTFPLMIEAREVHYKGRILRVATVRDMTEQKQAEQEKARLQAQLQQAQKMEAIGTLAGGIAHDFNNILTPLIIRTEMAQLATPEESPVQRYLEEILKATDRARELVRQILTFCRQSDQERMPLKISLIVKEALKLLRASLPSTIEIHQNIKADSGTVLADPTQIHQVLMNLCTNAAHAMREKGGVLEVSVVDEYLDSEAAQIHGLKPGSYFRLTVCDTGHGMVPAVMERIFEPYFTTKEKGEGTGLGLSVVHGIVTSYGGAITVDSEPEKGSTFDVFFSKIGTGTLAGSEKRGPLPRGTERILFVDDEKIMVETSQGMLEHLGYNVVASTSSIEALEVFRKEPDRFDLVITDMTMPKMTGDELSKELLKIRPDIPIILCTGYSEKIDEEKAKELGIREFVMKPVVMREMAKTVRKVLDEK